MRLREELGRRVTFGELVAIGLLSGSFVYWSMAFIGASSFVSIEGQRTYSLFDDAMISMRYAWNLSHAQGLVWNAGERVQGYSNLLMTLLMSLATSVYGKSTAVLAIQMLGIVTMLLIAFLAMLIADHLFEGTAEGLGPLVRMLAFGAGLAYYPLVYWSLMGMETGLLTLLMLSGLLLSFRYAKSGNLVLLFAAAILFGFLFLTRADAAVFIVVVSGYLVWESRGRATKVRPSHLFVAASVVLLFALAETAFQYTYYGEWLPNTYRLKLTGMPLLPRLQNGVGFVVPFLKETAIVLLIAVWSVCLRYRPEKLVVLLLFVVLLLYQVYVGGDAWSYWRMLAPGLPLVLLLSIDAIMIAWLKFVNAVARRHAGFRPSRYVGRWSSGLVMIPCLFALVSSANGTFLPEIALNVRPYQAEINEWNVNTAIALTQILRKNASIGVFYAGALPYYADFRAIDFLGKSDRHIARLAPDLSGSFTWAGMYSVPGHNKYDLEYSIIDLRPTYVQAFAWGSQDVSDWADGNYLEVDYHGLKLRLLKDSKDVDWAKVQGP